MPKDSNTFPCMNDMPLGTIYFHEQCFNYGLPPGKINNKIYNSNNCEKMEYIKYFEERAIGRIIGNLGTLDEGIWNINGRRYDIFLTEKDNQYHVVIKETMDFPDLEPFYTIFRIDNVEKLRDFLDEAIKRSNAKPLKPK